MNRDDVTRMAREAGFVGMDGDHGALRRFAALVAAAEREAIKQAAEREMGNTSMLMSMPPKSSAAWNILQAINARGQA